VKKKFILIFNQTIKGVRYTRAHVILEYIWYQIYKWSFISKTKNKT